MKELYEYGQVEIRDKDIFLNGKHLFHSEASSIDPFLTDVYEHFVKSYPKFYKMDRISKLGFLAIEILLENLSWIKELAKEKVAVLVQTAQGSLDTDLHYMMNIQDPQDYFPSPSVFVYTLPNIVIGEVCIRNGFKGENLCLASENFDFQLAETAIRDWLSNGQTALVLVGWVEVKGDNRIGRFYALGNQQEKSRGVFSQPI